MPRSSICQPESPLRNAMPICLSPNSLEKNLERIQFHCIFYGFPQLFIFHAEMPLIKMHTCVRSIGRSFVLTWWKDPSNGRWNELQFSISYPRVRRNGCQLNFGRFMVSSILAVRWKPGGNYVLWRERRWIRSFSAKKKNKFCKFYTLKDCKENREIQCCSFFQSAFARSGSLTAIVNINSLESWLRRSLATGHRLPKHGFVWPSTVDLSLILSSTKLISVSF